jgi:hypothetical protein
MRLSRIGSVATAPPQFHLLALALRTNTNNPSAPMETSDSPQPQHKPPLEVDKSAKPFR